MRNVRILGVVATLALALGCESAGGPMAVYDLQPRTGLTGGEQRIQITGANFRQDIGYTVYFGTQRAGSVTILDTSTLLVATPAHETGPVDVVVAADSGPAFRLVQAFEYAAPGAGAGERGAGTDTPAERF